jgi:RNA polymerase sigma-70 factor (ECF subfamily)
LQLDLEQLYTAYFLQVYSFLVALTRDKALAEELTQETFFRAANHQDQFRREGNEFTWLCAIAKRLYYDELRRGKKFSPQAPAEELPHPDSLEEALSDQDMAYQIHVQLHQLEEPYKEVFQLRIFGELSFQKIGALFEKSENWARVTYHRAKLKLQERMRNHESM